MSSAIYNLYSKPTPALEPFSQSDVSKHLSQSISSSSAALLSMRPGMRRKSSASNLLSSFKSSSTSTGASSSASGYQTPTAKDLDSQSLFSETSHAPTISSNASAPPIPVSQVSSVESLRELVRKRISTISYLKSVHTG